MKNTFYELALVFDSQDTESNAYLNTLINNGIKSRDIARILGPEYEKLAVYLSDKLSVGSLAAKIKKSLRNNRVRISVKKLTGSDWLTRWERESKPFRLTGIFSVIPKGVENKYKKLKNAIVIDSAMAFGLGQHPTTMAMAAFITSKSKELNSILDVGTGTGILLILAFKLGIRNLWGLDISADAVESAKKNLRENRSRANRLMLGRLGEAGINRTFDMVCANILAKDILAMKKILINLTNPGGWIAVSGIWKDDFRDFMKKFPDKSLGAERSVAKNGWHSVLFRKD